MTTFNYPFSDSPGEPCSSEACPTGVAPPSGSVAPLYCGGSLVVDDSSQEGCEPCSFENESATNDTTFLGGSVVGFNGKLGLNGSESSVSIDIASSQPIDCETYEVYGETHNCYPGCSPNPSSSGTYNGSLGYIYTFNIGEFCFRGILSNHDYIESESGYRYRSTLTDGRQLLANVAVIMNDLYIRTPEKLHPNVINVLYELETSVGDECVSGKKCHPFGSSGNGHKGMLLKKVLQGIDGKQCQVPVSGACLEIDVDEIINIVPDTIRVSSSESNVLELITLACEECGYDFYVEIVGYSIKVMPVSHKVQPIAGSAVSPLFTFLETLSNNYIVFDRQYGEELTFEKSNKLIIGEKLKYLVEIDKENSVNCIKNDPGSITPNSAIDAEVFLAIPEEE